MTSKRNETYRLAKELWTFEALELSPAEFQARFDALYAVAEEPRTFWRLGGAANDYLRRHPQSICVPAELAPSLLKSSIPDGRVIGLKLLNRTSSDLDALVTAIGRALASRCEIEVHGGLCELSMRIQQNAPYVPPPLRRLTADVQKLAAYPDDYVREASARIATWIAESDA